MTGITGVGAYAPRHRIEADAFADAIGRFQARGIQEKAVADADEDALTMGYEAAVRALAAADVAGSAVGWLGFATANPPQEEGDLGAHLRAMLGVPESATVQVFQGSTRAGTRAIWAATDWLEADRSGEIALVVTADAPHGEPNAAIEHAAGAGAAAFVLEPDGGARLVDRAEHTTPYPGTRFRERGSDETTGLGITEYDRGAFTEPIAAAVEGLADPRDPDAAAIHAPDGDLPYRAARTIGIDADLVQACTPVHELGDVGAASAPLGLARALADGAETILAIGYGSGAGADALVVETADPAAVGTDLALDAEATIGYEEYLRLRGRLSGDPPSGGGAYISLPTWQRALPQRYRLEAGRCVECGGLTFPPDGACLDCGALSSFEPVELPGTGEIEAVTRISQGGAPPEFVELQERTGDYATVIVAFEAGEDAVSAPAMATGADPTTFADGDRVEATIRRIYTQEGVTRYGFKVRPVP